MDALISRGRPLAFLDALKNVLSLPDKLLFLNPHIDSNTISPEVEEAMRGFVARHDLVDTKIRINEYAPLDELARLFGSGRRVSLLWRLWWGIPVWIGYCMNVGRIFGGDYYNPFTDTVNLYSDHTSIALHELGHALDFKRRRFPGLYALTRLVPGFALYQEYLASKYAIDDMRTMGEAAEEVRAYRLLFPAYSTYVLGALIEFFPTSVTRSFLFPVVVAGHVLGTHFARKRIAVLHTEGKAPELELTSQWSEDRAAAARMFSPATQTGREQVGAAAGLLAGSVLCGPLAPVGAWLGFHWLRNRPPKM